MPQKRGKIQKAKRKGGAAKRLTCFAKRGENSGRNQKEGQVSVVRAAESLFLVLPAGGKKGLFGWTKKGKKKGYTLAHRGKKGWACEE